MWQDNKAFGREFDQRAANYLLRRPSEYDWGVFRRNVAVSSSDDSMLTHIDPQLTLAVHPAGLATTVHRRGLRVQTYSKVQLLRSALTRYNRGSSMSEQRELETCVGAHDHPMPQALELGLSPLESAGGRHGAAKPTKKGG